MQDAESYRSYVRRYCDSAAGWGKCSMAKHLKAYYDAMGGRPEREMP